MVERINFFFCHVFGLSLEGFVHCNRSYAIEASRPHSGVSSIPDLSGKSVNRGIVN